MEKGLSKQESFERAKEELQFRSDTAHSADLQEKIADYYVQILNPASDEAIGLFMADFCSLPRHRCPDRISGRWRP